VRRQIPGLSQAASSSDEPPDGEYLVRIARAHYRWDKSKPYYVIRFEVMEPGSHRGMTFNGRIYYTVKALWKLNWFLRDFGYDPELLGKDELDERVLRGLTGVIRISHKIFDGHSVLNLEAFGSSDRWSEMFGTDQTEEAA
jgi:hypothetical protein